VTTARRKWAYERGTLWASEASAPRGVPAQPRVAATFGEAHPEDAGPLAAAMGLPDPQALERRFDGGRRCFVAWDGTQIASYGWVSQGRESVGEMERTFHMQSGEAYIWDCVTLPQYRGRGLYSALLGSMLAELRGAGVGRVWIGASLDNQPSIKGFARAGFQPVIEMTYLRLLGLRCDWVRRCPGASTHLAAAARRMIGGERAFGPLTIGIGQNQS
jgi:ribosomal protein S18 acetylase RimI-like enzyme